MSEFEDWQNNPIEGGETNPSPDKRPRQRFQRVERTYSSGGANEQSFRPQGFNTSGGNDNQRGYGNRGGYGNRNYGNQGNGNQGSNYGNRGGYSKGGYNNQSGYNRQGGYNNNRQGGYQRGYGNQNDGYNNQAGFRPSSFGQQTSQGGYNKQGGYNNRQNGYNNNRQGGYSKGGYSKHGAPQKKSNKQGYNPNSKYSLKKQIEYQEYITDPSAPLRLNKFLANAGVCSRREADEFIQAGVVTVNGQIVTELGTKVFRTDEIHFHDQLVSLEKKVYVLLNKPKDYVTTVDDPQARKTVLELVKNCCKERIYPVGRLDRNTTGVLLFTNDGELAAKLSHPKFLKKKVYHVHLDKNCTINDMKQLADGIQLEDGEIHADAISYASDTDRKQVGVEIHSGKNRIVRRMFEALGYKVMKLDRVMFAGLTKKGLKKGDWRYLTEQEVAMLHMGSVSE